MNVVHVHPMSDTGGQSMAGKAVLEAAGHDVRVFAVAAHKFKYPDPEPWDVPTISAALERADTIVVHNDARILSGLGGWRGKRIVLHHHGSHFRGSPELVYERGVRVGARQVVSTVDLLLCGPDLEWFPQVVDVDAMRAIRASRTDVWKARKLPLVTHAPTNRRIKGTKHVERAGVMLRGEVDVMVIRRESWATCLNLKASSDVFVDQLNLGYGNNAIEAWAMGIPVISAASEEIIDAMRKVYPLPFYLTSVEMLADDMRMMATEPVARDIWAGQGMKHVERYHAPKAWMANALAVYS